MAGIQTWANLKKSVKYGEKQGDPGDRPLTHGGEWPKITGKIPAMSKKQESVGEIFKFVLQGDAA
jgi:hypothetical protein